MSLVDRLTLPADTFLDGSYRIVRVIGAGGFGITYEAMDIKLATRVAIKEYFPLDFGDRDASQTVRPKSGATAQMFEWGRENFLTEAKTLASFDHSSIVRVLRVFEANDTAYMVMRYENGMSFEAWLKSLGRLPSQGELDAIARPLLEALEALHSVNYLHRDIAPDNIIIRADGTPVLLDFGSARHVVAEKSRALTGIVKAGYSPQEQYATDNQHQGPWTDIYALGGTLYRAVTGKRPLESMLRFDASSYDAAAVLARGAYRAPFLEAIDRSLAVRPTDRPQSVKELYEALFAPEGPPTVIIPRAGLPTQDAEWTARPAWQTTLLGNPKVRGWSLAALLAIGVMSGLKIAHHLQIFPMTLLSRDSELAQPRDPATGQSPPGATSLSDQDRREAEKKRLADLEAERLRVEAEKKRSADAEAARLKAEAEKKRLADLEAERLRVEAEKKRLADAEAARLKAEAEKKRLADLEAERLRVEAEKKRLADAEAARVKLEAEQKRLAEREAERLNPNAPGSPGSRQDGGRDGSLDPRIPSGPGEAGAADEFLASYRELLRSQECSVATLTSRQLEVSVAAYVEAVNKAKNAQLEIIDVRNATRAAVYKWLEKAYANKSPTCPMDLIEKASPPPPKPVAQPVHKAPPAYRPSPAPPARAPQAPSQRTIMGIQ